MILRITPPCQVCTSLIVLLCLGLATSVTADATARVLENQFYRLTLDADGSMASLFDKQLRRELIDAQRTARVTLPGGRIASATATDVLERDQITKSATRRRSTVRPAGIAWFRSPDNGGWAP